MKLTGCIGIAVLCMHISFCTSTDESAMQKEDQNIEIAMRLYGEVLNEGNLDVLNEIMAEDFIDHLASPEPLRSRAQFVEFLGMVTTAYPDIQLSVEEVIASGDKVVVRLSFTGTHSGPIGNVEATGRKVRWTGIDIVEVREGLIRGRWSERNLLGMMIQLGAFSMD